MPARFTNRDLAKTSNIVFSHTDEYFFPALFANRDNSRAFLQKQVKRDKSGIIIVSDILGSGKTVLVNMVIGDIGLKDNRPLIAGRTKPNVMDTEKPLFIDEWDIKANPKRLLKTLKQLKDKMKKAPGPVILLGDLTLKSTNFTTWLQGIGDPIAVPMEPLNPEFFNLALGQRLNRAYRNLYGQEKEPLEQEILQPELSNALVPEWEITTANFREVFSALTEMSFHIPQTDKPGLISEREAMIWLNERNPQGMMSTEQKKFYKAYIYLLVRMVDRDGWPSIKPMNEEFLKVETGFSGMNETEFSHGIIEPLARTPGIIAAMGFPEISEDGTKYNRFPGPYLPGTQTRIHATFGDVS